MFGSLARLVTHRGWVVVFGWLAVAVLLALFAPELGSVRRDDDVRFFPPGYPSVRGQDLLERGFPDDVASSSFVVVGERRPGTLTPTDFAYLDRLSDALARMKVEKPEYEIRSVSDHRTPILGPRLIGTAPGDQGQAALVNVALKSTHESKRSRLTVDDLTKFVQGEIASAPEGLNVVWTGSAAVGHDRNAAANQSIEDVHRTTILLVVAILLIVYRSPLLAMIPVASIALSVFVALKLIALLTTVPHINFQVINITNLFVSVILFGAGTDYCLFLIARYREELARGRTREGALSEAIRQVGGALVASAGTVIVGLGTLYFSSFAKIQYTGPAIALSLGVALAAALTLAPVVLNWFRGAVFWPFRPPHHEAGHDPEQESLEQAPALGFWTTVANVVVSRPALILALSVAGMVPFAVVGLKARPNYDQTADLSSDEPSMIGTRVLQRYFPAGELGPSTILIGHPAIDFRSDAGVRVIADFTTKVAALPNIAEVRAVSRPLGKPLPRSGERAEERGSSGGGFLSGLARLADAPGIGVTLLRAGADPRYVSTKPAVPGDLNHITRVDVVFRSDIFSPMSMATLRAVFDLAEAEARPGGLLAGAEVGLTGATAQVNDLEVVTVGDQQRMYVLVTVGVYLILVVLLRRPGICLYLIATVILGYLASLGLTELVFQWLQAAEQGPWVGLDWKVGFFLFVILVAVGEDYNILLMARVIEEERKHGPIEGTRLAVAHTGGIISSCGLIMAGTFLSMMMGRLSSVQQLGFALGVGILLDTFIVRPVLVPAFIVLWHQRRPKERLASAVSSADPIGVE